MQCATSKAETRTKFGPAAGPHSMVQATKLHCASLNSKRARVNPISSSPALHFHQVRHRQSQSLFWACWTHAGPVWRAFQLSPSPEAC